MDIFRFEQLKASGDLPSPKGVALAIMRLTLQDDVSMADLAQLIRSDPAFVGRLVKAANGVVGYGRRAIVSIPDALTVLGLPAVRNMALGFSLLNNYRNGACEGFDYSDYWASSLLTAVGLQAVTHRTRVAAPEETYCLGLLSRVGELALATLYPHDYARVCRAAEGDRARLLELEAEAFATTNAELGAAMMADWGFPRMFSDAAFSISAGTLDSHPQVSRPGILERSLSFADTLSRLWKADDAGRAAGRAMLFELGSSLQFDDEAVHEIASSVTREWLEWSSLLDVPVAFSSPFEGLLAVPAEPLPAAQAEPDGGSAPAVADGVPAVTSGRQRVLLAEPVEAEREALRTALIQAGYEVACASDGFSATEMALEFVPEMLLLADGQPDVATAELLSALRRTRIGRGIYIVQLSREGGEDALLGALESGADDVLVKPVSARLLLARLAAGRRLTSLHNEIEQDREEIRHFAAELAVSNRRLKEVALTDVLTGFPNRRFFNERLRRDWDESLRNHRPLSCLLLDVDHFKEINDARGHDTGDRVLCRVAAAIRSAIRSQDTLARLGGDEFVVLCPDAGLEAALLCAERIRRAVQAVVLLPEMGGLTLGVSVGVATRDASANSPEELIKRADQGLYQAKQAGRNRVGSVQPLRGGRPRPLGPFEKNA
ncbi:MAG: diguanylate cyclase [Candidatus Dactylopiibacterium sp.]|nr:diguanylate cyclase [Candidatus Dactylopiibacterium sp.]